MARDLQKKLYTNRRYDIRRNLEAMCRRLCQILYKVEKVPGLERPYCCLTSVLCDLQDLVKREFQVKHPKFISEEQMDRAIRLYTTTDLPIKVVLHECGIGDTSLYKHLKKRRVPTREIVKSLREGGKDEEPLL